MFPFFTVYAAFSATDEELAKSINVNWLGDVFFKLLIKPVAIVITILGVLIGAAQLTLKVATTAAPMFKQLLAL